MNKSGYLYFIASAVLFGLLGCANLEQIGPSEPVCLQGVEKTTAMEAAEDVLARMQFVVEKYDTESGFIKTKPLRGSQIFEFWRGDNVGRRARAEANLHSIRRTVVLNLSETETELCIECDVQVQRLSISGENIESMSKAAGISSREKRDSMSMAAGTFSERGSSVQELKVDSGQMDWVELGRDGGLEKKILERIKNKIAKLDRDR